VSEPEPHSDPRGWEGLARAAAAPSQTEAPEVRRELLRFRLVDSAYAIAVERVREIVRMRPLTPVPRVPEAVIGVIALRGEIVQVLDLRTRLSLPRREVARSSRIIVLHGDDERVTGVLVDAVEEVVRAKEEDIRPAASGESGFVAELCIREGEFVSILDLDRVLDLDAG
jgi:purine-binding chemotaxis protein CheW